MQLVHGARRSLCLPGPSRPTRPQLAAHCGLATTKYRFFVRHRRAGVDNRHLVAMYSSFHRGIITDPGLMALPVDDHMANRGHGMFDTGTFREGRFYRLGAHSILSSAVPGPALGKRVGALQLRCM